MTDYVRFVNRFKHYYTACFQDLCEQYGLTQLEVDILLFLYHNPENNTARDIVALRGLAKSNVSTSVEALRRDRYLEATVDPRNRRKRRLHLLPDGQMVIEMLADQQRSCLSHLAQGFTEEELCQLQSLLERIENNMCPLACGKTM